MKHKLEDETLKSALRQVMNLDTRPQKRKGYGKKMKTFGQKMKTLRSENENLKIKKWKP